MPEHASDILDPGKVSLILGDMTEPQLGLKPSDLELLQKEVRMVIHAAATLSILQELLLLPGVIVVPSKSYCERSTIFNAYQPFSTFLQRLSTLFSLPES